MTASTTHSTPVISIIVLNYNGAKWLPRCLESLSRQTIFSQTEIIVADNNSPDGSALLAEQLMEGWVNGKVIQHGVNLGFCEGNNRAAKDVNGEFLFFLNNDTWLEPLCLERLLAGVRRLNADAATPLMLNYENESIQSAGGQGFDLFGLMSLAPTIDQGSREIFVVGGCSYLIRRNLFERLGGFDVQFFMYADEYDLSWRLWISGARAVIISDARLHHRGAASVNPAGGGKVVETRSSDAKRFYTNRNCLLVVLKNCENILLAMFPLQLVLLAVEGLAALLLVRRWSFLRRAYWEAVVDCWRLRGYVRSERRRIKLLRSRSDWQMLRFLCLRFNRLDELQNVRQRGLPKFTNS